MEPTDQDLQDAQGGSIWAGAKWVGKRFFGGVGTVVETATGLVTSAVDNSSDNRLEQAKDWDRLANKYDEVSRAFENKKKA